MTYLRDVAVILKQRFPNLTVDETLALSEQLLARHERFIVDAVAAIHHAARTPEIGSTISQALLLNDNK